MKDRIQVDEGEEDLDVEPVTDDRANTLTTEPASEAEVDKVALENPDKGE